MHVKMETKPKPCVTRLFRTHKGFYFEKKEQMKWLCGCPNELVHLHQVHQVKVRTELQVFQDCHNNVLPTSVPFWSNLIQFVLKIVLVCFVLVSSPSGQT